MTDFSERFSAEREARNNTERAALRSAREQERDEVLAAEAMYRELTPVFARHAAEIHWAPTDVVVTKTVQSKPGLFSKEVRTGVRFDRTLGKGWVVEDRDPSRQSSIGIGLQFLVLADCDWIALNGMQWGSTEKISYLSGLPRELKSVPLILLHPREEGLALFRPQLSGRDYVEKVLIAQLHFVERNRKR